MKVKLYAYAHPHRTQPQAHHPTITLAEDSDLSMNPAAAAVAAAAAAVAAGAAAAAAAAIQLPLQESHGRLPFPLLLILLASYLPCASPFMLPASGPSPPPFPSSLPSLTWVTKTCRTQTTTMMVYVPPPPPPQSEIDASAPPPSTYAYSSSPSSGWLDAWSLLLKEIRPPIPSGAPRSFVELVRTDRQGRKRTLSPAVKDAEMRESVRRFWRILSPELGYLTTDEVARVKLALEVSCLAHQGQKRKSGAPFIEHPVEVARILAGLSMDVDTICAGLLHDTAEDTHLRLEEIGEIFGEGVRQIVEGETKVSKLAKLGSSTADYEETQAENLRSLFLAMCNDYRVIYVKLCDRLHNMRTLQFMSPAKQMKISRETLDIYAPLADRLGVRGLKSELEDIAFRYVYPKESEEISAMLANRSDGYEDVLASTHIALHQMLERKLLLDQPKPLNLTVTGRLKEKYSLWRKMDRKAKEVGKPVSLDDIKDVVAMRIVINVDRQPDEPESEWKGRGIYLCFRVMYLVQRHLSASGYKSTVEDYVSIPKVNGYQSLHATIMRNGQVVEVQIRTDWYVFR